MIPFRRRLTPEQQRAEFVRIQELHTSRAPIIMERGSRDTPTLDKEKFLVPYELTVAQFSHVIRRRIKMDQATSIFLIVNNLLPCSTDTIRAIYDAHASEDGFLYITYTTENASSWIESITTTYSTDSIAV